VPSRDRFGSKPVSLAVSMLSPHVPPQAIASSGGDDHAEHQPRVCAVTQGEKPPSPELMRLLSTLTTLVVLAARL
jgi:hypothetical protein